jgi:hypothetical protein
LEAEERVVEQEPSPWARPAEETGRAAETQAARVAAVTAAWRAARRAAAAATADRQWARPQETEASASPSATENPTVERDLPAARNHLPAGRSLPSPNRSPGETGGGPSPSGPTADRLGRTAPPDPPMPGVSHRLRAVGNARLRTVLSVVSPVLVFAAGITTVAGSTMTWATVRTFGFLLVTVRGTDDDQHGRTTIALGALAMLSAVLLASRRGGEWGRLLAGTSGLMTSLTATVDIAHLRGGSLLAGTGVEATTDIGPGLWLILGGGLAAFGGAILARLAGPDAGGGGPPARRAARSGDSTRPVDPRSGDDRRKLWGRDGAPGSQQTRS